MKTDIFSDYSQEGGNNGQSETRVQDLEHESVPPRREYNNTNSEHSNDGIGVRMEGHGHNPNVDSKHDNVTDAYNSDTSSDTYDEHAHVHQDDKQVHAHQDDEHAHVHQDDEQMHSAAHILKEQIKKLEIDLHQKTEKIAELENQYLRVKADTDNYKKRMEREKVGAIEYANSSILLDVIGVLDNFDRALISVKKTEANATLFDGVILIKKEWISMLENNWGVREIKTLDQAFDPQLHEAVAIEENDAVNEDHIGAEFQKGYLLHSRVLRPAKVKVLKPAQDE